MKGRRHQEDDLLTPALAINPNQPEESVVASLSGVSGHSGAQSASTGGSGKSARGNKKGRGKAKQDASHLLAFSVASDRVNAGELDMPE